MAQIDIPWQQLVEIASEGMCVLDDSGCVRYANPAVLNLLGLSPPAGRSLDAWLAELGADNRELITQTFVTGGQTRLHFPDAEFRHLIFEAESVTAAGLRIARVRRDLEGEAAETMAIMVHELRLPMTSIIGYAKLLSSVGAAALNDLQREFLDTISRNVERLNRDLAAIQDMTRIDRGKIKLMPIAQNLGSTVAAVLAEFRDLIEAKGHQVTLDFPPDLPLVHADHERLKQVLRSLLDNALKYTPHQGRISLRGRVWGDMLQIDVQDSGLGMPASEQGKVFSRFFRGEAEGVREHTGLGLGLYIARGLVALQGGQLWFESSPGEGTTFCFTLPISNEGPPGSSF